MATTYLVPRLWELRRRETYSSPVEWLVRNGCSKLGVDFELLPADGFGESVRELVGRWPRTRRLRPA